MSLYKVVTKILASRLSPVISDLISDVQTAFLPNRKILDGPFIINELLSWCKHKKQQVMVFKVDFAKAYDFIRISIESVNAAALNLGCSTMKTPFKYLGVMVRGNNLTSQSRDDTICKCKARLSNWKLKTLFVRGRLTLLKSVLGSTPIYNMSIYKVPKSVLHTLESIRRNFFNGVQGDERKITWIKWTKVLASKKYGGLDRGVDLISHCHIRVGNGLCTQFWNEVWIGDTPLRVLFPRVYALEINKDCTVADKLQYSVTSSLRRTVRGGVKDFQLDLLQKTIETMILSNMEDRWVWDMNGEGVFRVKDVRTLLDECFLPKAPTATRWVKYVPIKINVFAWKVFLDRLPTRSNLQHRGVQGFFMSLGGAYGCFGISCSSRRKSLLKMLFSTILFRALSLGATLDVIVLLAGTVGCNTPI
nr:RNA-directed DNA polymerase, eukaryota, reverse transcriptase zinc-binding domain protein [Tanacetum cinerariifolium]